MGKLSSSSLSSLLDLTTDAVLMDDTTIDTYEWLESPATIASPVITDALRALSAQGLASLDAVELV